MSLVAPDTGPILDAAFLRRLERMAISVKKVHLGAAKGERRSKRKGTSMEFADYRGYVQGDDLRHVDWNIYSRLDELCLKLFQEFEDITLHLLLDASLSMNFGTPRKFEFGRKLLAALGYIGLAGYDRVSIGLLMGGRVEALTPVRGKASANKMLAFLQDIAPEGSTSLDEAVRTYALRQRSRGVYVIISDFMDEQGFEGPLRRLCATRSDIYVIQVLAPEEITPQLSGDLKLIDSESESATEISVSRALMKRYFQNRDAFIEQVRTYCLGHGMSHFLVSSQTPVENVLLDVLRRGGLIR
ncbi:MAG: DUF58 domain-containing protein [Candidatus Hydrogenedentes bacterium]|nr:DUF58 domain-containing protein [Candidatus Hydrogenedentota bacterium]